VDETPRDKGLTMKLELTVYDNGLITINGRPLGDLRARGASTNFYFRLILRQQFSTSD
jgi:hypothetical protein